MQASVIETPYCSGCPGHEILAAGIEVAFDHHAEDALVAGGDLRGDVARDLRLLLVPALAVGVRAVDHQPGGEAGGRELLARRLDAGGVVIRRVCRRAG